MELMNKDVKVTKGYYEGIEGTVTGVTVDGYWLVTPKSLNSFWAKTEELMML